ncbi:hypothetical protein THAOC_33118, partial [Thalassiosira oceanica]
ELDLKVGAVVQAAAKGIDYNAYVTRSAKGLETAYPPKIGVVKVPMAKTEEELNGSAEEKKKAKASRDAGQGVPIGVPGNLAEPRRSNDEPFRKACEQASRGDKGDEDAVLSDCQSLIQLVRTTHDERKTSTAMYLDAVDRGVEKFHNSGLLVVHRDHVKEALASKKLAWADSAGLTDEEKANGFSVASHAEVEAAITAASVTTRAALGLAMVDRYGQCGAYKDNLHNNNGEMPPTLALLATAVANHKGTKRHPTQKDKRPDGEARDGLAATTATGTQ